MELICDGAAFGCVQNVIVRLTLLTRHPWGAVGQDLRLGYRAACCQCNYCQQANTYGFHNPLTERP